MYNYLGTCMNYLSKCETVLEIFRSIWSWSTGLRVLIWTTVYWCVIRPTTLSYTYTDTKYLIGTNVKLIDRFLSQVSAVQRISAADEADSFELGASLLSNTVYNLYINEYEAASGSRCAETNLKNSEAKKGGKVFCSRYRRQSAVYCFKPINKI